MINDTLERDIMQFHLNGFRVGDPTIEPAAEHAPHVELPETVDVLIAGSGPAGLVLAAQLSQFPSIRTRIVERRAGPLMMGQADGVACRTRRNVQCIRPRRPPVARSLLGERDCILETGCG
ncbi:hypothetical protein NK8_79230 (plasmid) [Caballeronia sp. NK8]|nr:hypothetical protein NK8_79230 [Caballeronia sp. NK8]